MNVPITQTKAWQKLQQDLGETSFYREEKNFSYLAIKKSTPLGAYLYSLYGPVFDTKDGLIAALNSLNTLAKEQNAFFIRIEPQPKDLFLNNLPKNARKTIDLCPKETWLLSLEGCEEELKKRLPSRLLRYYKNREKNNLTIETSKNPDDIKYLLKLQKDLAKKKNIGTFSERYLKTELSQPFATLYLVKHDGVLVAAGLVFDYGDTRYNLQGAQTDKGRELHATGILTVQLILDAQSKNLQKFDFWGIAPEGAPSSHPWAGFTNFKKTFAGYEVDYAGTYDLVLNKFKYKLYQIMRTIRRKI